MLQAEKTCIESKITEKIFSVNIYLAEFYFRQSNDPKARAHVQKLCSMPQQRETLATDIDLLLLKAKMAAKATPQKAVALLNNALKLEVKLNRPITKAVIMYELARIYKLSGEPVKALNYKKQARLLFKDCHAWFWLKKMKKGNW